jgi:predicted nucleotidyltransferase
MNYHSDEWVKENIQAHYNEALEYFPEDRIVGIFCQGSTNYGLDTPESDIDTKLIVVPTFEDIVFNKKPQSTTHVRANNEHIDFKDIRLMLGTFRKQNLNFIEILFTKYKIVNPLYAQEWNRLIKANERIAHYNPYLAVKAMKGVAMEKYHALEHPYPAKLAVLEKFGYDGKQLHHLLRIEDFLERYIAGDAYEKCLSPENAEYLKAVKAFMYSQEEAEKLAEKTMEHIEQMSNAITKDSSWNICDNEVDALLNDVQSNIMKIAVKYEMM